MGKVRERLNLLGAVDGAHFGGLSNGDHSRLRMMFVADAVIGVADRVQRDFTVLVRQRNQLAARVLFGSAAFVGVDVSVVTAQDGVKRPGERLQAQNIGASSVESEKNYDVWSKVLLEFLDRRPCVSVVTVSHYMALISSGDGGKNLGMYPGIVIAGKIAGWLNGILLHSATT